MSDQQAAISFKLPRDLKERIDRLTEKHDLTLTGLILGYFKRRLQAEVDAERRGSGAVRRPVELLLILGEELSAAVHAEAGRQGVEVDELVYQLLEKAVGAAPGRPAAQAGPESYTDFPKLVDCVRRAYLEDRSPIDALLELYPSLAPSPAPMGQLFAAALSAVSVDQVISERVSAGLRALREQRRHKA